MGEYGEEDFPPLLGEEAVTPVQTTPHFIIPEAIREKKLTFEEASNCLNTLGKDESGVRYAYLMITATDRKLTDVSIILNFKHVLFVDLSINYLNLEALQVLSGMPFLLYLKAEKNRIESAALDPMYYLQCLILSKNKITETCDINQPLLETLELEDNLIYTIQFDVERVNNLRILNLSGNQLIDFSGTYPTSLEKLFLSRNKISKILVDFSQLTNLVHLHLRENEIKKLNGFSEQLHNLTYLNLRNNKIGKLREFRKLQCLPKLDTLIILQNPIMKTKELHAQGEMDEAEEEEEEMFGEDHAVASDPVRIGLIVLLPNLVRINKDIITYEEREEAELKKTKILEEIFDELSSEEETEMPTTTGYTTDYTTDTETGIYNTRDGTFVGDEEDNKEDENVPEINTDPQSSTAIDTDAQESKNPNSVPQSADQPLERIEEHDETENNVKQ